MVFYERSSSIYFCWILVFFYLVAVSLAIWGFQLFRKFLHIFCHFIGIAYLASLKYLKHKVRNHFFIKFYFTSYYVSFILNYFKSNIYISSSDKFSALAFLCANTVFLPLCSWSNSFFMCLDTYLCVYVRKI